jgi:hypothetical protein
MSRRASTELSIQKEVCKPRSTEISGATESDSGADTTKVIHSTPECEVRSAYRANTLMVVSQAGPAEHREDIHNKLVARLLAFPRPIAPEVLRALLCSRLGCTCMSNDALL